MRMTKIFCVFAGLAGMLGSTDSASATPPAIAPIYTTSLPGFPGDNGHDAVAYCGDDVVYVRYSDRAIRLLRQDSGGGWTDAPFPEEGSSAGSDLTRVYGSGNFLAVVYWRAYLVGRAEIYERNDDGFWGRVQVISSPAESTFVNLHQVVWSGSTLLLVDRYADSFRGAAYVYQRQGRGQWVQEAKLQGSGATPFYTEVWSAGLDGDRAVLGHWLNPCGYGVVSGRAYVFERSADASWTQQANFRPPTAACSDAFAANVSIAGDLMYASAPNVGRIYRLRRQSGSWSMTSDVPLPSLPGVYQGTRIVATAWGLISRTSDARLVIMQNAGESMLATAIVTPETLHAVDCYCWNIAISGSRVATITGSNAGTQLAVFEIGDLVDCDGDGVSNADEILAGSIDGDANGIPDSCEIGPCAGDVNGNGAVNAVDLAIVLAAWGTDGGKSVLADANRDGIVDALDLAQVLSDWGPCPE